MQREISPLVTALVPSLRYALQCGIVLLCAGVVMDLASFANVSQMSFNCDWRELCGVC